MHNQGTHVLQILLTSTILAVFQGVTCPRVLLASNPVTVRQFVHMVNMPNHLREGSSQYLTGSAPVLYASHQIASLLAVHTLLVGMAARET